MNTAKKKTELRAEIVAISCTAQEKAAIEAMAKAHGLTVSAYCRWQLIEVAKQKNKITK